MSYNLDYTLLDEVHKRLDDIVEEQELKNRFVVMFGSNVTSNMARIYLDSKGIKVYGIIDNNRTKNGVILDGIKITLPTELLGEFNDKVAVLIGSSYYREMCQQLEKMGYVENKHIFEFVNFSQLKDKYCTTDLRPVTSEEEKNLQMEMLRFVKRICKEEGLRYYLCGGTLLGAIRHKGYIPWDDDIDILMPGKDLKKLVKILEDNKEYTLLNPYTSKDYYFECAKLIDNRTVAYSINFPLRGNMGVNIDIFPLDGLPDEYEDQVEHFRKLENLHDEKWQSFYDKNMQGKTDEIFKEIVDLMGKYDFDKSRYVAFVLSRYSIREITPREIYNETIQTEFEGEMFQITAGYDRYLTDHYDDYMTLPPVGQRVATHQQNAYWK